MSDIQEATPRQRSPVVEDNNSNNNVRQAPKHIHLLHFPQPGQAKEASAANVPMEEAEQTTEDDNDSLFGGADIDMQLEMELEREMEEELREDRRRAAVREAQDRAKAELTAKKAALASKKAAAAKTTPAKAVQEPTPDIDVIKSWFRKTDNNVAVEVVETIEEDEEDEEDEEVEVVEKIDAVEDEDEEMSDTESVTSVAEETPRVACPSLARHNISPCYYPQICPYARWNHTPV
jgi:hypothetical protein